MLYLYIIGFAASLLLALIMTPFARQLAFWVKAVDKPNQRKVHTKIMPRLGGIAIFLAFAGGFIVVLPVLNIIEGEAAWSLLAGGAIIMLTGVLDDRFQLSPKWKLLGIVGAACLVVFYFDLKIDLQLVSLGGMKEPFDWLRTMDWLSAPLTILWIVGVTNAINLIDGLDGLAAGVTGISAATMLVMAIIVPNPTVILLCAILLGSIVGFLFFNFYPAKIFMGDSGALFLGFSIATLSILGFKQTTVVSFVVPLLMIGVPISDTFFAVIRRFMNKKPIFKADKGHLHHCLMKFGFSHRMTVLIIYCISALFGVLAIVLPHLSFWISITALIVVLLVLELLAEAIGLFNQRKPVLNFLQKLMERNG